MLYHTNLWLISDDMSLLKLGDMYLLKGDNKNWHQLSSYSFSKVTSFETLDWSLWLVPMRPHCEPRSASWPSSAGLILHSDKMVSSSISEWWKNTGSNSDEEQPTASTASTASISCVGKNVLRIKRMTYHHPRSLTQPLTTSLEWCGTSIAIQAPLGNAREGLTL